jgi:hypothetical protein
MPTCSRYYQRTAVPLSCPHVQDIMRHRLWTAVLLPCPYFYDVIYKEQSHSHSHMFKTWDTIHEQLCHCHTHMFKTLWDIICEQLCCSHARIFQAITNKQLCHSHTQCELILCSSTTLVLLQSTLFACFRISQQPLSKHLDSMSNTFIWFHVTCKAQHLLRNDTCPEIQNYVL